MQSSALGSALGSKASSTIDDGDLGTCHLLPLALVSFSVTSRTRLDELLYPGLIQTPEKPVSSEAQLLPQQGQGGLRWMELGPGPTGDWKGPKERMREG